MRKLFCILTAVTLGSGCGPTEASATAEAEAPPPAVVATDSTGPRGDPGRPARSETPPEGPAGTGDEAPSPPVALHPDEGRCPGWAASAAQLACNAVRSGKVVVAQRSSLRWQVALPFDAGATLVQVELPEKAKRSATSIGLEVLLSDGSRPALGQAAAVFAVDNDFEAVERDQVGVRSKPAIDVSGCEELRHGWALRPTEFGARGSAWHVVLEPPGAMAEKRSRFNWGRSMRFVVVNALPKCEQARVAREKATALVARPSEEAIACGGGVQ